MSYRERLYEKYAQLQEPVRQPDPHAALIWRRSKMRLFRGWLPAEKDAAIVDLACGDGQMLYCLSQAGYTNLRGVEISPGQVELARKLVPGIEQGEIIDWISRRRDELDLIIAQDVIEHMHKDEVLAFLDGCSAALKVGGRLILHTPNAESLWIGMLRYGDFTHEIAFNTYLLTGLLELCGLGQVEAREVRPYPHGIASSLRLAAWMGIRLWLQFWNFVETGCAGSGIYTRVFAISGVKQRQAS